MYCLACNPPPSPSMDRGRLSLWVESGRTIWLLNGIPLPGDEIASQRGQIGGLAPGASEAKPEATGKPAVVADETPQNKKIISSPEKNSSSEKIIFTPAPLTPLDNAKIKVPQNKKILYLVSRGAEKIFHLVEKPNKADVIALVTWDDAEKWHRPENVVMNTAVK